MVVAVAFATILLAATTGPGAAAPITTLKELMPALARCTKPAPDTAGSELTIALTLNQRGELLGRPAITYAKLVGDYAAKRQFVASILVGLAECTPVTISEKLGQAVAGRRLTIRFRSTRATQAA